MSMSSREGPGSRVLALAVAVITLLAVATGVTLWVKTATAESASQAAAGPRTSDSETATGDQPTNSPREVVDPTQWKQLGGDEFNGSALDTRKWVAYTGVTEHTGENWTPSLCGVAGGELTLAGQPGPGGNLCGVAWLKDQTYGRWLVRARMPKPANPQFALVSLLWPHDDSAWPAAGEIDYAEEYDPQRSNIQGWLHYGKHDSQLYVGKIPVDTTQWHTYGVEWEPDHVSYLIDNQVVWRTTDAEAIPTGPMHQTLQLNLNREYQEVPVTTVMQVDWLHIYAP